jgi:hypothetical protein
MGACLLGHLLSLRTGMAYEELLRTRILVPLGMTSTHLYQEPSGIRLATPYHHSNIETDYFMVPMGLEGAGRIRSTARDMARFARAAMGLDATPLDAAFELSEGLHFQGDGGNGTEVEMGLGWGRGHAGGALFIGHGGGTWGFTTAMNLDRTRQHGTIIVTNSRHAHDCLPSYLTYWLSAWQKTVVLDPQTLSQYPGQYWSPSGTVRIWMDGGHLLALVPHWPQQRISPEGNDRFYSLSQDLELKFDRAADGRISGLEIRSSADPGFAN